MNKEHILAKAKRNVAQSQAEDKAKIERAKVIEEKEKALEKVELYTDPLTKEVKRLETLDIFNEKTEAIRKIELEEWNKASDEYQATIAKLKKEGK